MNVYTLMALTEVFETSVNFIMTSVTLVNSKLTNRKMIPRGN